MGFITSINFLEGIYVLLFRCLINIKTCKITKITNLFNSRIKRRELKRSIIVSGWILTNIVMQTIHLVCRTWCVKFYILNKYFTYENQIKQSSSIWILVTLSVVKYVLLAMSFNTFAILYVNICHHLKQIVERFHNYICIEQGFEYDNSMIEVS